MTNKQTSILILGATGLTGLACIQKLSDHPSKPQIHAFCRSQSKLGKHRDLCTSVVQGDARKPEDIRSALEQTNANWIVVAVGNGNDVSKSDIRTVSGQAIAKVLTQDPAFGRIRTVVVSSNGAGGSKIIVGLGIGSLISFHLRHVMKDHTGQEAAFKPIQSRTIIVRPTSLTTNAPTGKLVEFGDKEKGPSIHTDRSDLAEWISQAILNGKDHTKVVNLTGVRDA